MEIQVLPAGIFDSNTYILSEQGECAVIDCGADPERILKTVADNKLKVRYIILYAFINRNSSCILTVKRTALKRSASVIKQNFLILTGF